MPAKKSSSHLPLKPDRIPERIVTQPPDQPSPQRIGHDIARHTEQILLGSQAMIMEARHSDTPLGARALSRHPTARRLQPIHQSSQAVHLAQLNQPMGMIRHQHPGEHMAVTKEPWRFETAGSRTASGKVAEYRLAVTGDGSDQIGRSGAGSAASAQGAIARFRGHRHESTSVLIQWCQCSARYPFARMARSHKMCGSHPKHGSGRGHT